MPTLPSRRTRCQTAVAGGHEARLGASSLGQERVDLPRQAGDVLGQRLVLPRQVGVRLEESSELRRRRLDRGLVLVGAARQLVAVALLRRRLLAVALGLTRRREKDERRRV